MASQTASSASALRALTYRITSTSPQDLAQIAPQIASSIWTCRDILSIPAETKQNSETSTLLHRFKTQLSTLLQDRSVQGRWAAVVLTKATIEAGGLEVLSKCSTWVKSLLAILKRPDPPSTRCLAVLTLTRIFALTWEYSNLIREITTPALTAFVPTCLANIENKRCSAAELETILEAFATLVPRHPTIFRTNESKLRSILTSIISSRSSVIHVDRHFSKAHRAASAQLLVLLHHCAPKQGGSEKWHDTLRTTIEAAHATCDRIFRCIHEDWQSVAGIQPSAASQQLLQGDVESESDDAAGLKPWKGVYAGSERLISLLELVTSHLSTKTSATVNIRVGVIVDLLTRLFGIVVPTHGKQNFVRLNNQITREEREALFAVLPRIHSVAMQTSLALHERLGSAGIADTSILLDQLVFVFGAENADTELRRAVYQLLDYTVKSIGASLTKNEVAEIGPIVKACCQDLLPGTETRDTASAKKIESSGGINKQLGLAGGQVPQSHAAILPDLVAAAQSLLRVTLLRLDATTLAPNLRAQIDRTAVLIKDKNIMLASVMNPPRKGGDARVQASLLPILARHFSHEPEVECLLRPRMPPIRNRPVESVNGFDNDETEMDEERDEEKDVEQNEANGEVAGSEPASPSDQLATEQLEVRTGASDPAKRRAMDDEVTEATAKRLRTSEVAESLLPERAVTFPEPETSQPSSMIPVSVPPAVVPKERARNVAGPSTGSLQAPEEDDDDSDIEIPEVIGDPDTEDEEQ